MSRRPGPRYPSSSCSWERCGAGVFADGSFTGVVAAGLTLLAVGGRPGPVGCCWVSTYTRTTGWSSRARSRLQLSAVIVLKSRDRWATAVAGIVGVGAVVAAFTAAGFCWLTDHLVVRRYHQGWAADRPYGYWVWADRACLIPVGRTGGAIRAMAGRRHHPVGSPTGRDIQLAWRRAGRPRCGCRQG